MLRNCGRFFVMGGAALILAVFGLLTAACENPGSPTKKAPPLESAATLESIAVTKSPDKIVYARGEKELDRKGIKVTAYYSDNSEEIVDNDELEFSVLDSSIAGDIVITVEWKGKTATFTITVGDSEEPDKEVDSIEVITNPAKMVYTVGESIDLTGLMLLVNYDDGTDGEIPYITLAVNDEFSFEPDTAEEEGELIIIIQYRGVETNFPVTVVHSEEPGKEVDSIEVTTNPAKMVYTVGESIDLTGLVLLVNYDDGTNEEIPYITLAASDEFSFEPATAEAEGELVIIIQYRGAQTNFPVTVGDLEEPDKEVDSIEVTTNPAKTAYTVGESIDLTGLVLLVNYDDGTDGEIPYITLAASDEFSFEPATAEAEGELIITIQYRGAQTNFPVTVTETDGGGGDPVLSGDVSITPASTKTGTQLTAAFAGTGTVVYYQWKRDGINVGANSKWFTADTAGIYTVTVSGSRDGSDPITSSATSVYAMNGAPPIITSRNTADPSAHVWAGRLYLYPSTDRSPVNNNRSSMDRYHVYSTDNMVDWIDHGEILRRDNLPESASVGTAANGAWGPHHASAFFMAAPDAAYRTGVSGGRGPYFFYFPHALDNNGSVWTIGVAWSANPYGEFKNNVVRLKTSNGNYVQGDGTLNNPCIFQDGNDYYLVTGGNQQLYVARLSNDMVSLAEPLTPYSGMSQLQHYREGPWMFTRTSGGTKKYYLMYSGNPSGGNDGDELLYATGNGPSGPWTYQGAILDPSGTGSTSQGSVVEFSNKWYLFYHNAKLSEGIGNLRSVCVNELSFNEDGTIRKVIQTAASVAQNGPNLNTGTLNTQFGAGNYTVEVKYSEIESGSFVPGFIFSETILALNARVVVGGGATKQTNDFPAGAIHNLHLSGSYVDFTGIAGNGGRAKIRIEYANGGGDGTLQVRLNGTLQQGTISVPPTDGWSVSSLSDEFIINSMSGNNNTIRLSGVGVNIVSMTVYLEEQ